MANQALQNLKSNSVLQRLAEMAPAIINMAIVAVLGWWLAGGIWAMVPVPESVQAPVVSQSNTFSPKQKKFYGAEIANQHLFGEANAEASPKEEIGDAPDTRLDLVLRGVLAHDPMEFALALISRGRGSQEVYGVGDRLPGNAELVEVHADRVIIEYQGRYETLRLPESAEVDLNAKPVETAVQSRRPQPVAKTYAPSTGSVSPQVATQMRREFLDDPSKAMKMVNIKQEFKDGQLLGYQVTPKGDAALFNEIGLQAGDILVSVNGIPLSNTQELSSLRRASRYDVVVLRGGAEVPLTINFE